MDRPFVCEIRVAGHLTEHWSDWFDGLAIRKEPGGETTLTGEIRDQAGVLGLLNRIQGLNLTLVSVRVSRTA